MGGNSWKGPKITIYLSADEKRRLELARVKAGGKAMSKFAKEELLKSLEAKIPHAKEIMPPRHGRGAEAENRDRKQS